MKPISDRTEADRAPAVQNGDRTALKASLATIICHGCWGLSFLASRTALNTAHVFVLLSHRFLIAFLLMHLALPQVTAQRWTRRQFFLLLLLGLAQPVFYFFFEQFGILHATTGFSGVMIAMIPVFTILAAAPLLKERPTLGQLFFSLVSVGGVIGIGLLTGSSGTLDWIGVAALLGAVVSGSAYSLLSRRISDELSSFSRTYMMVGTGAVVFTALALLQCRGDLQTYVQPLSVPSYLWSLLFLSAACSVLSFFLSNYAITRLPLARETVFANLTTVVSVIAGVVVLHEPFSWLSFLFCLLILTGIYGVQRTARKTE